MEALWISLIPIAIALVAVFGLKLQINVKELAIQIAGGVVILCIIWFSGSAIATHDTEVLNGYISEKSVWRFSCPMNTSNPCRNDYSCNCHQVCSGSGKDRRCRTECDTCYVYPWEQNWYAHSSLGTKVEINRVDRQGALQPDRWTQIKVGDGYAETHGYNNWVKASAGSLFKKSAQAQENYASLLPKKQPVKIYDYYRIDRVIAPNIKVNETAWNDVLTHQLTYLGPKKQLNFWVVFIDNVGPDYAQALQRQWKGFKKNDAVIFIGTRNGIVSWGESISWSKNSLYDVQMREHVKSYIGQHVNTIKPVEFMNMASAIAVNSFERRPMEEFEYLKGDIIPPTWLVILSVVVGILWGVGTSYFFHRYEI